MKVQEVTDEAIWNEFLLGTGSPSVLQSFQWGELKSNFSWQPFRLMVVDDDKRPLGGISLLKRAIPKSGYYLFYAPRGPVFSTWSLEVLQRLIEAIKDLARREKVVFLRIDPNIKDDDQEKTTILEKLGFAKITDNLTSVLQPRCTMMLDLSPSVDELLKSFKEKHRYNIRLARKKGVKVDSASGVEGIERFYKMMEITQNRQKFAIRPLAYYQKIWEIMEPKAMTRLFVAEADGEDLSSIMVLKFGQKIWYMYGGSSNSKRNLMPNYLLQWEVMRWAKEAGCTCYDMWGIPHNPKPGQALWGVYRFKKGFNGEEVTWAGCYDLPFNKAMYKLLLGGWRLYRGLSNLKTRGRWLSPYGEQP